MPDTKSSIKVALAILISSVLFFFTWRFFAHKEEERYPIYVEFENSKGLAARTPIRMNGVVVGEVKEVVLDSKTYRPRATLLINKKQDIPSNARLGISSGLLITNAGIEFKLPAGDPGPPFPRTGQLWPKNNLEGASGTLLATVSPEADAAVRKLSATMNELVPKVKSTFEKFDSVMTKVDTLAGNFTKVSASVRDLAGDPKIRLTMNRVLDDLAILSKETRVTAVELGKDLKKLSKDSSGKINQLTDGLLDVLQKASDTTDAIRGAVTRLTEQVSDPRVQQSLIEALDLAKTTVARFSQIADDIHRITGDSAIQTDIKGSVSALRSTVDRGNALLEKVDRVVSKVNIPEGGIDFGLKNLTLNADFLGRSNYPHFRADLNARLPIGKQYAFNLGLFDVAETNRINAQVESIMSPSMSVRYGLYASRLGLGLNLQPTKGSRIIFDAFDPNRLRVDAKAIFDINRDFSLYFGIDELFKRTTPVLGVRLRR